MSLRPLASRLKSNEEKTDTTFGHLPYEMLEAIFDYLNPIERQKIRPVSRSWNKAVTQLFVTELHIKNTNLTTLVKSEGKFLYVVLPNTLDALDLNQSIGQLDTLCSRLQKLKFSGRTLPQNILLVLPKCQSLKKLIMDAVILQPTAGVVSSYPVVSANFSNLVSLTYHFSGFYNTEQMQLFQSVVQCIGNGILRKLKIVGLTVVRHASICPYHHGHGSNSDILVLAVIHGSTGLGEDHNNPCTCMYWQLLGTLINRNQATLRTIKFDSRLQKQYDYTRLQFYRQRDSKLWLEQFTGTSNFFLFLTTTPGPFLQLLLRQHRLQGLDLTFNDLDSPVWYPELALTRTIEETTSQIMLRNAGSLTSLKLKFLVPQNSTYRSFSFTAFKNCINLRFLALMHETYATANATFTGMGNLPQSLKYFETDFSIGTQAHGMRDVALTNLSNLERLVLSGEPMFVFNGPNSPNYKMTLNDFKALSSKLPALKLMHLKVVDHPFDPMDVEKVIPIHTVTRGLFQRFQNELVSEYDGQFLRIELNRKL